jgi:hypothetical protein
MPIQPGASAPGFRQITAIQMWRLPRQPTWREFSIEGTEPVVATTLAEPLCDHQCVAILPSNADLYAPADGGEGGVLSLGRKCGEADRGIGRFRAMSGEQNSRHLILP